MSFEIKLREQKVQPVLSVRKVTSVEGLPEELGKAYGSIIQHLSEMGEVPADAAFAAYYNMDMENLDVEMGFPVSKRLAGKANISYNEIPAGRYVECMHKGPYADSVPVYDAMNRWIAENGLEATGTAYEYYYNSPADVPESELLTKIVFPVK